MSAASPMRKNFLFAFALTAPMILFYLGYFFNHSKQLHPTGFIQYDNVAYVAYGKQYNDADTFHLQYSNPFNESDHYKPIYFQTQSLFFALLLKIGVPVEWILIPFNLICSVFCFLLLIAIYDCLTENKKFRSFIIWMLAWGGGLLCASGIIAHFILKREGSLLNDLFFLDPEFGWWGLNFGRSIFFSCEAYYHLLFLGSVYALLRKKWTVTILLMAVLSLSHPFTGIEFISIISVWCLIEFLFNRREIPAWFLVAVVFVLCFHLYYYLIYLEKFPEHKSVSEQYALRWRLGWYRIIPAYGIVGLFAILSICKPSIRNFFRLRSNRILICWFVVAFLLANHEIFIKARQPIHFTRGYIWTSLFLLGLPALTSLISYFKNHYRFTGLILFAALFFSDNFLWIGAHIIHTQTEPSTAYITDEQKKVFTVLCKNSSNKTLLITEDNSIAYLSTIYTKAYPWYSHPYTTPYAAKKLKVQSDFFTQGKIDSSWTKHDIRFVINPADSIAASATNKQHGTKIFQSSNYIIYKVVIR